MKKLICGLAAGAGLGALSPRFAQAAEISLDLLAQAVTVSKPGQTTRYIVPGIVTVVLFAAALFVICKTSRRV